MSTAAARPEGRPATLRSQLGRALMAAAVALGVLVLCALIATVQVARAQSQVTQLYDGAVAEANQGYVRLLDAETAVRGFTLTADPAAVEQYGEALGGSGRSTAELADDLASDTELFASRERAVEAARRWIERFAEPTIAAVQDGGTQAVSADDVENGRVLFDATRSAVESYLEDIRDRRAEAVDDLERWTTILVAATATLAVGAAAVGLALWATLDRWVTRPLAALAADARHVGSGDLGHRVRAAGPGEIAALAEDVETMRQVLVRQVDSAAAATAELDEAHRRLTEQAEELQRSNRDLEQFAYVASHDLQEPLRKVASFTQLLQKRYGGQLDERADQYIDFAVDGAKRMQRLIQDLLGFSRVGRMSGQTVDVDMADALAEAVSNLDEAVAEAGATVTHGELPTVRGERPLLVQLLQNLVGNAVKFRAPDRPPQVRVTAWRSADAWEFECRDNGIGIDAQYADRVFVIFQRLHAKDAYDGTGIGLSLCKKIVEYHGGHIWLAAPDDGPGASVRWSLPVVSEPEPDAGPSTRPADMDTPFPEPTDDDTAAARR